MEWDQRCSLVLKLRDLPNISELCARKAVYQTFRAGCDIDLRHLLSVSIRCGESKVQVRNEKRLKAKARALLQSETDVLDLRVSFPQKDIAKCMGAKWDTHRRVWTARPEQLQLLHEFYTTDPDLVRVLSETVLAGQPRNKQQQNKRLKRVPVVAEGRGSMENWLLRLEP